MTVSNTGIGLLLKVLGFVDDWQDVPNLKKLSTSKTLSGCHSIALKSIQSNLVLTVDASLFHSYYPVLHRELRNEINPDKLDWNIVSLTMVFNSYTIESKRIDILVFPILEEFILQYNSTIHTVQSVPIQIKECPVLQKVVFNETCCSIKVWRERTHLLPFSPSATLRIANCPSLSQLCIPATSFYHYTSLSLERSWWMNVTHVDLSSIEELRIGITNADNELYMNCFSFVRTLKIQRIFELRNLVSDLLKVRDIVLGSGTFLLVKKVAIERTNQMQCMKRSPTVRNAPVWFKCVS